MIAPSLNFCANYIDDDDDTILKTESTMPMGSTKKRKASTDLSRTCEGKLYHIGDIIPAGVCSEMEKEWREAHRASIPDEFADYAIKCYHTTETFIQLLCVFKWIHLQIGNRGLLNGIDFSRSDFVVRLQKMVDDDVHKNNPGYECTELIYHELLSHMKGEASTKNYDDIDFLGKLRDNCIFPRSPQIEMSELRKTISTIEKNPITPLHKLVRVGFPQVITSLKLFDGDSTEDYTDMMIKPLSQLQTDYDIPTEHSRAWKIRHLLTPVISKRDTWCEHSHISDLYYPSPPRHPDTARLLKQAIQHTISVHMEEDIGYQRKLKKLKQLKREMETCERHKILTVSLEFNDIYSDIEEERKKINGVLFG